MIPADFLLTNGLVVTMDESYTVIPNGAVAIRGDSIVAVGPADEISREVEAREIIDCTGLTITPGLVNAHTHVPMTLLRGLADDLRLDVWLTGYMMPVEREFVNPDFVQLGTLLACAEMIRSGVTTFADMYYFERDVAEATARAGMRGVLGQTILKFPAPDAESYEESLSECRAFIEEWKGHPLVVPAVAPHAPYTSTPEILQACAALAVEYDVPLHIHIAETKQEVEDSRAEHNMPVVPWIKKHNILDAKVIAAHCVHIDSGEIRTLYRHNAGIAHNPSSNLKLASGIAPVGEMLEVGVAVGIGTDGPASNNDLDMFEEMRLAALLAKVATDNPTTLPARQAFDMATRMGARALHLGHLTGSLEVGKRADIAVLDLRHVHSLPAFERSPDAIYSRIVYSAKSTDVQHVMCNGQWLMRDRELLTIQPDELLERAAVIAAQIDAFLIEREDDIVSKLLALGELEQQESFEVQVKVKIDDPARALELLEHPDIEVVKHSHYRQYDTYFEFGSPEEYRLRYREDDFIDEAGRVTNARTRLTLTGGGKEREFENAILLSRSRFISEATRPLRFYREYLQAERERMVTKERRRWHVDYKGMRLYINVDDLFKPEEDRYFLELKSRTWSPTDAENKAAAISELLEYLGIDKADLVREEYFALAE
ncbi:MAG: amidohydrolase family protein [Aggregatilineales bacterium]|nr:amidohydrolase family protein [Aggregatilineales bacterium]HPV08116.1 amidohydrolase family protein [Aggregatilineales bacterium]HQE17952.1 amidohydrolase family protein [Aggregatilineales bacterium]